MTEKTMTRLAMVLQNQAPSTLEKYIQKLAENVLLDYENGLNLYDLENEIRSRFNLSFSSAEILSALQRRSNKTVLTNGENYYINLKTKEELSKQESIVDLLNKYVNLFISSHKEIIYTASVIEKSLLNYFYFCFNSNVNNLLLLLNKEEKQLQYTSEFTSDDIIIINSFIEWDNNEKNEFIYRVIAICYEYCMLTVKNDRILTQQLFSGKRFFLDTNIIFRMAGINKDERRRVTASFIDHCKKAGIKLCCTTATYDEVYRVINAQIGYIKGMTKYAPPVSPQTLSEIEPNYIVNDFYNLYYEWSHKDKNHYNDYTTFHEMLLELVRMALNNVDIQPISDNINISSNSFKELSTDLREYKNKRLLFKTVSKASSDTDIINLEDIISKRKKNQESIWQTNDFIVSADQHLISWTNEKFSGIPIVVLPSVWLSIILRFTGRTSDDYNSFCLFLTQREHKSHESFVDPMLLINKINNKTNQTELRERVIKEISEHKYDYSFEDDTAYNNAIDKAFDKIVNEMATESNRKLADLKQEMDNKILALSDSSTQKIEIAKQELEIQHQIDIKTEKEKTLILIAKTKAKNKIKKFQWLNKNTWFCYLIGSTFLLIGSIIILLKIEPFWSFAKSLISHHSDLTITILCEITLLFVSLISICILKILERLGSQERQNRLSKKYEIELRKQSDLDKQ